MASAVRQLVPAHEATLTDLEWNATSWLERVTKSA